MMKTAHSRLCAEGYVRYEISNYAKPGFSCKHNIKYWQNAEHVGVGPSATTFIDGVRSQNVSDLPRYFSILDWWAAPHEYEECLDAEKRARETLFLGLRMREGVDLADFRLKTGCDVLELCGEEIARFSGLGLVEFSDGRMRLTDEGVYVADSVFAELV
jgi:oxygen-independent coproporphyrinogen-3 oxidase